MSSETLPDIEPEAFALRPGLAIHFVGIGGIGMSALARHFKARGMVVSGSDAVLSPITSSLEDSGITIHQGHAGTQLPTSAVAIVVTAAVAADNQEVAAARRRNIPILSYAEALNLSCAERQTVAVAGTHGKTTTTAMIAWTLVQAGVNPGALIGGLVPQLGGNAVLGQGDAFVTEACEYAASFLKLTPKHAVITNVGDDHLDYYGSLERLRSAFRRFAESLPKAGLLVTSARVARDLDLRGVLQSRMLTVGGKPHDVRIMEREKTFGLLMPDQELSPFIRLLLPGKHNRMNAAMAAVICRKAYGLPFPLIMKALSEFEGVERRFRVLQESATCTVVDDYAHHPAEVEATLLAARERFPNQRLVAVFQPHMAERVKRHFSAFLNALAYADEIELVRDYEVVGRDEADRGGAASLAQAFRSLAMKIVFHESVDLAIESLKARRHRGEVYCIMGAGDIGELSLALAESLR